MNRNRRLPMWRLLDKSFRPTFFFSFLSLIKFLRDSNVTAMYTRRYLKRDRKKKREKNTVLHYKVTRLCVTGDD